jgi:predicted PurR-regulated permease PerM
VTIAAGCLMGMIGLVLAAPVTSAAVHISRDLRRARERAELSARCETASEPLTA